MLYLIRHAHTDWNGPPKRFQGRADVSLSPRGERDAEAGRGDVPTPTRLISSPLSRCRKTAALLFPGIEAEIDQRWVEMDVGRFSGKLEDEVARDMPEPYRAWIETPHLVCIGVDGERLIDLIQRVGDALMELQAWSARSGSESVVVVTHGGVMRAVQCLFGHVPLNAFHSIAVRNLEMLRMTDALTLPNLNQDRNRVAPGEGGVL